MMKFIQIIRQKLLSPKTIEEALCPLVGRDVLRSALELSASQLITEDDTIEQNLIDVVSKMQGHDSSDALLVSVSQALKLKPIAKIETPNIQLIERTGYDADMLCKLGVVPREINGDLMLVVADPALVDRIAYERIGISLGLTVGSEVKRVWQAYQNAQDEATGVASENIVLQAVEQLCSYAATLGAREVLIGIPSQNDYEFVASGKRFRGSLNAGVFLRLLKSMNGARQTVWNVKSDAFDYVRVSHMHCGGGQAFYVSWDRDFSATDMLSENTPETALNAPDTNAADSKESACQAQMVTQKEPTFVDVLLIDDDPTFRMVAGQLLSHQGYEMTCFPNAKEAYWQISSGSIIASVIVCDLHMPCMNGMQLLGKIRESGVLVPFLMLTSDTDELAEAEAVELGVDAFVRKQESPKVLLAWVKNCVARQRRMNERAA